ncbi:hypothetical protein B808_309 [Fructilactobacillus florum 8D]|uniref:Uncharacterized protein n=1 Tax=Fructilactobacillus florum 8D TaxID=1221538 RepID=W9EF23_9LACO|nr:hypothetical protein B808_309 [Fructilactobacillus florum 8D]
MTSLSGVSAAELVNWLGSLLLDGCCGCGLDFIFSVLNL